VFTPLTKDAPTAAIEIYSGAHMDTILAATLALDSMTAMKIDGVWNVKIGFVVQAHPIHLRLSLVSCVA
jgi:hypothetical protein